MCLQPSLTHMLCSNKIGEFCSLAEHNTAGEVGFLYPLPPGCWRSAMCENEGTSGVLLLSAESYLWLSFIQTGAFPGGSVVKNLPANTKDAGSVPRLERSPGERNGNLLQYSCLGNPLDRGAWRAVVPGVAKSWT